MADHFSDIGFHFESVEDMEAFLMSVFPEQTTVCELPIGKLAFYAQENDGVLYWIMKTKCWTTTSILCQEITTLSG